MRIPSGATNIDVRQHSYSGKPEDDNYLGKTFYLKQTTGDFISISRISSKVLVSAFMAASTWTCVFVSCLLYVNESIESCTENLRRWHI